VHGVRHVPRETRQDRRFSECARADRRGLQEVELAGSLRDLRDGFRRQSRHVCAGGAAWDVGGLREQAGREATAPHAGGCLRCVRSGCRLRASDRCNRERRRQYSSVSPGSELRPGEVSQPRLAPVPDTRGPASLHPVHRNRVSCNLKAMSEKIRKDDAEWRQKLTPEQYQVTRKKGTEPPFTGEYENTETDGVYHCVCCGQPLFAAEAKYHSGSGWPSYYQPIKAENVEMDSDVSHGMARTEVMCSRCDAHLGHVFEDGPEPTGLRFCINSAALKLEEKDPEKKDS